MKKKVVLAVILSLSLSGVQADEGGAEKSAATRVHYIKSPGFVRPLVEKWITEYAKVEPDARFQVVKSAAGQEEPDLNIVLTDEKGNGKSTIYFGEYAILPVTARSSEAERLLGDKRLSGKKLKELFFVGDELDDTKRKDKNLQQLIVYSGNSSASVASPFASYFGEGAGSFRGKRISGDDVFLNTAIGKDPLGVTFNALSNLYDLQSRQLKSELSIIRLDLKKGLGERISNTATIDDVIGVLEDSGRIDGIPVESIGLAWNGYDERVGRFLQWVLTTGTNYNHQYGLLNLSRQMADAQAGKLKSAYTAQK